MIFDCKNIEKYFGAELVLKNISFNLEEKDKLALVGVNGAGKTTLFKIVLGELQHDKGEISLKKGAKIGYISQNMNINLDYTIYEELMTVFANIIALEEDIRKMQADMSILSDSELQNAMVKYSRMQDEFEVARGYEVESRVRGVLKGLNFDETEQKLFIKNLSGGQKTRVALGKLLLQEPDILLLDEPTNHLDIKTTAWLEEYLQKEYKKAVIVISHDRYFIDKVCTKVVEIEHGVSKIYNGNYSYFFIKKAEDFEIELKQFADQQKVIKKQEESIKLLRSFNREKFVKRAESKQKQLNKLERVEKPKQAPESMRIKLEPKRQSGNDVLQLKNACKSFGERLLFNNVNMDIKKGEVVALIGENGVGKTTLFNMIRGLYGEGTSVVLGTNVKIGYYDQQMEDLSPQKNIFEEIADSFPTLKNSEIRDILATFLFIGDDVFKSISQLSGGEKGRVSLAKLMLSEANFLMLDEPTNHLDLFSKEILEHTLLSYSGTVLYISHDRYFINNTAQKIYEITQNGSQVFLGNYDYYLEKSAEIKSQKNISDNINIIDKSTEKQMWQNRKQEQAEKRKTKAKYRQCLSNIEQKEKVLTELSQELTNEYVYSDYIASQSVLNKKEQLEQELLLLYEELENLSE